MKPEPAKFTRENPCTKLELWQCFRRASGFVSVEVVEAQSIIGENAPRYMERAGYLSVVRRPKDDRIYYRLTERGQRWLTLKFKNFLKNHPERRDEVEFMPD